MVAVTYNLPIKIYKSQDIQPRCSKFRDIISLCSSPIFFYHMGKRSTTQASNRPIPSPLVSSLTFLGEKRSPAPFSLPLPSSSSPSFLFDQPFFFSAAHAPQELMYTPALWPAALMLACILVRSGVRVDAKRASDGELDFPFILGAVEALGSDLVRERAGNPFSGCWFCCVALLSIALRLCVSRKASISFQTLENAVETFFWPVANCLFRLSLVLAKRSSK